VSDIGIVEAVEAVRAELLEAMQSQDSRIQFPIDGVQIAFQVGVTKGGEGSAGVRVWVLELGGKARYEQQRIHTVTLTLGAPVDENGDIVKVNRQSDDKP
jgi:hypothetical protein